MIQISKRIFNSLLQDLCIKDINRFLNTVCKIQFTNDEVDFVKIVNIDVMDITYTKDNGFSYKESEVDSVTFFHPPKG